MFGPWVGWDVVGWNGDYTLDYNYEATFYGVYSSNHPELASSYFRAVVDAMGAARRGAAERASALNLTCASSSLHYNAHIGPWGAGDYDESWEERDNVSLPKSIVRSERLAVRPAFSDDTRHVGVQIVREVGHTFWYTSMDKHFPGEGVVKRIKELLEVI